MNTSKIVFKISRFNKKSQLILTERYNAQKDTVTSMGRVIFNDQNFISGLHLAIIDGEGNTAFSFDKEAEDIYQSFNISLPRNLADSLQETVKAIPALAKPSVNDNGVSTLKGYQLHVEVANEDIEVFSPSEGNLTYSVKGSQVVSLRVVTQAETDYVRTNSSVKMSLSMITQALHKTSQVAPEAPKTASEAKDVLTKLSRAGRRASARKAYKASKQLETTQAGEGPTPESQDAENIGEELL